ncbi:MAG: MFS transporter [Archaeoglobi archaeon]|nr:MFS transporter [Candidatus Mnemosynella sp.]
MRSRRTIIFLIPALMYFFSYFHRVSPAVLVYNLVEMFSFKATLIGLISSAYFYSYAIAQIPVGILADSIGPKRTLEIFSLIMALGTLIFAFGSSEAVLIAGRALIGFGAGGIFIPSLRLFSYWFKPREYATVTGTLMFSGNLGALFATAPLAIAISSLGWRGTMLFASLIIILSSFLCHFFVGDSPVREEERRERISFLKIVKTVLRVKNFVLLYAIAFLVYGSLMIFQGLWGGRFLSDIYGFSREDSSFILLLIALGVMLASPTGGLVSDRILKRRKPVMVISSLLMFLSWIPLALLTSELSRGMIYGVAILMGISTGLRVIDMTIGKESLPEEILGRGLGLLNISYFIGAAIFQPFMGFIMDAVLSSTGSLLEAYHTIFMICLGATFIGLLLSLLLDETIKY